MTGRSDRARSGVGPEAASSSRQETPTALDADPPDFPSGCAAAGVPLEIDPGSKTSPVSRLYWMATGILGYFLVLHLSLCATKVSTLLGYMAGMRNSYLTILACIVQVTAFAGIGTLVLRHHTSHSKSQAARKISGSVRAGIFVACAIVALWWIENLSTISWSEPCRFGTTSNSRGLVVGHRLAGVC